MRPVSIHWFDKLFFTELALGTPFPMLEIWQSIKPDNAAYLIISFFLPNAVYCILWFLISHRANNAAKWVWSSQLLVWMAAPFLSMMAGGDFVGGVLLHGVLGVMLDVVRILMIVVATTMLFRPDAAKWFSSRGKLVDVGAFR